METTRVLMLARLPRTGCPTSSLKTWTSMNGKIPIPIPGQTWLEVQVGIARLQPFFLLPFFLLLFYRKYFALSFFLPLSFCFFCIFEHFLFCIYFYGVILLVRRMSCSHLMVRKSKDNWSNWSFHDDPQLVLANLTRKPKTLYEYYFLLPYDLTYISWSNTHTLRKTRNIFHITLCIVCKHIFNVCPSARSRPQRSGGRRGAAKFWGQSPGRDAGASARCGRGQGGKGLAKVRTLWSSLLKRCSNQNKCVAAFLRRERYDNFEVGLDQHFER